MQDDIRRVAYGYTRVSTEEQVDGASLENQRIAIQKYADQHNIEIVGWYTDAGISAKTAHRAQLQVMLEDISKHKGEIDYVVVYNISRISRNLASFSKDIGYRMASYGVTLRSIMEPIDETPTGRFMLNIALSMHQLDNDIKSQTVKDNMALLAKKGWWMSQAPLGLKLKPIKTSERTNDGKPKYHNTLEIDERNNIGENIRELINRFSDGDITIAKLLRLANKMDVKGKNGKPLSFDTMNRILRHPAYAGYNNSERLLGGEQVKIINFDGIITMETYNKNQRILNGDKRELVPNDNSLYPLKGLLICPHCGVNLRGSAPTDGGGKRSPRYHCCAKGHGSIKTSELHELFIEYLQTIAPNESTVKLFKEILKRTAVKKLGNTNIELNKAREEVSVIDAKLNNALEALLEGKISQSEKNRYSEALMNKRRILDARIDELEHVQRLSESIIDYVCNFMMKPAKLWADADLETKQAFQATMFPKGLHFDIKSRKFGTGELSPLYRVVSNKKEPNSDSDSDMVTRVRVERTTSSLGRNCSIH